MVRYAQEAARLAPRAWIINFTNPVGIITQAVRAETSARIIGICDTPTELFEGAAHTLGLDSAECYFDYFGLNHLGWLREVYYRGDPQLHRLWAHADLFVRIYRAPLFEPEFLATLRLLPTEYLYYYYRPSEAFEHMRASGRTRGQVIAGLNEQLFGALAAPGADVAKTYEKYLATRNDSYMTLEAEAVSGPSDSPWASLTGYDKIALAVVRAIHFNTGAVIPLNVRNQGNLPDLEVDDVIEVPCVVNANGAIAVHVDPVPDSVRDLMVEMKRYERLTMRAALSRSPELTVEALAANPLVRHTDLSRQIIGALAPLW